MSILITIRGNSGSGKTTLAKALQKSYGPNTMVISQDVIRRDMLFTKDGASTLALPLLKDLLVYGSQHSDIAILEGILNHFWYASLFEEANRLFSNHIYSYYFDLSFEETLLRHQTKPNCHDFGAIEMKRWWMEKDYSPLLKEKILTKDMSLETMVSLIQKEVHYEPNQSRV